MTKTNRKSSVRRVEIIAFGTNNESGRIVKTKLEAPAPGYHLVRFDADGGELWFHESRLIMLQA